MDHDEGTAETLYSVAQHCFLQLFSLLRIIPPSLLASHGGSVDGFLSASIDDPTNMAKDWFLCNEQKPRASSQADTKACWLTTVSDALIIRYIILQKIYLLELYTVHQ